MMHGSDGFQCAPFEQILLLLVFLLSSSSTTTNSWTHFSPGTCRRTKLKEEHQGGGGGEKKAKTADAEHPVDTSGVLKAAKDGASGAYDITIMTGKLIKRLPGSTCFLPSAGRGRWQSSRAVPFRRRETQQGMLKLRDSGNKVGSAQRLLSGRHQALLPHSTPPQRPC